MRASDARLWVGVAVAAALTLAACGGSSGSSNKPTGALAACGSGAKAAAAPAATTSGILARSERRPREHPGRHRLDDLRGERLEARQAWTFKLTGKGRGWDGPVWFADREPDRAERRRVSAGSRLERIRARALDRKARVGVPHRRAREERTRTERRRRGRRRRLRSLADHGVRAQRHHRSGNLGEQQAARRRSGHVRHPAAGRERPRISRQPVRLGVRGRRVARARMRRPASCCGSSTRWLAPRPACRRSASAPAARGRRRS